MIYLIKIINIKIFIINLITQKLFTKIGQNSNHQTVNKTQNGF